MAQLARMRTVKEAYTEIKKADPDTALSFRALERIVKKEKIPVVLIGRKHLIDLDTLFDYLKDPDKYAKDDEPEGYGKIRAIY